MHWNYTYIGDGTHLGAVTITTNYSEEIIGFDSASQSIIQVLAKRIGQNGVLSLQSPIPAPFNGRVEMIPANGTLVIRDLQYNDSSYQFSSNVKVTTGVGSSAVLNTYKLKPTVTLAVNGMNTYCFL